MLRKQMILLRKVLLAVDNNGMTFKQYDCSPNDCWYVFKVRVNRVSMKGQQF